MGDGVAREDEGMTRIERLASGLRWRRIEGWIRCANALGREDVGDMLVLERLDACQDAGETAALIQRARAVLLLEVLHADE